MSNLAKSIQVAPLDLVVERAFGNIPIIITLLLSAEMLRRNYGENWIVTAGSVLLMICIFVYCVLGKIGLHLLIIVATVDLIETGIQCLQTNEPASVVTFAACVLPALISLGFIGWAYEFEENILTKRAAGTDSD